MVTRDSVIELLKSNDRAVARALVALTARQTQDEQSTEHTRYRNGMGFRPCHARMGTSMSKFFERRGYLTPKQVAYWRAAMRDGKMRIEIYAGQLVEVAQAKALANLAQKADAIAAIKSATPPGDPEIDDYAGVVQHRLDQAEAARIAEDAAARDAEAAAIAAADRADQEGADYHSLHQFLAACHSLR
jgi:hypothetical protein